MIDSHAHVGFPQFDGDRGAVLDRARAAGVVGLVEVGTDLQSSRAAVALAERHTLVHAAVGVHPHDASTITPGVLNELRVLARDPKVVALGEIGLDYHRDLSPRAVQRQAFVDQLALAADLGLPVVVHVRDAVEDVLAILRTWDAGTPDRRGVFHSYSGGPERLSEVLGLGFHVGISGPVTFPNADRLRQVATQVDLGRLLVETDCPYLTPVPYRGRRNEPAYVRYVVEEIARVRGMSAASLAHATEDNARRLFGLL
jgi:TatD DNase family protein